MDELARDKRSDKKSGQSLHKGTQGKKRRKRQSSFLWIPLTLENQSRGHVFLEHLLQSLDHIVSGFLEISVLVASSSLLHEDRTGEDLCTYRPQGWPWGNWGWTGMDGVECMG